MALSEETTTLLTEIQEKLMPLTPLGMARNGGEYDGWWDDVASVLNSYGFEYLGQGMGRLVATPRPDTDLPIPVTDYNHDHPDSVVVKFARRSPPGETSLYDGYRQNSAEAAVWDAVTSNDLPLIFDASDGTTSEVKPEWFAPVRGAADTDEWIVSTGYARLTDAYEDLERAEDAREHIVTFAEAKFLEGEMRPDMSEHNLGFRDIPLTDVLFNESEISFPRPEEVTREDRWVMLDTGVPNWEKGGYF